MKKMIMIFFLLATTLAFAQAKIVVHVPGMVCQMCVQGMQKGFKSVVKDPLKDIIVDLDKKTVSVNLIKEITDDDIKERVKNAGYNVSKIERLESK